MINIAWLMERKKKVMIVDDNLIDQMITLQVLKTNYKPEDIMIMENASEAIDYINANQANPFAIPCLIVLDLDMPGMNGLGFLEKFREFAQSVKNLCKIIVLTGSEVTSDIELMQTNPYVFKLLSKPLCRESLLKMI